ncbi:ArsA family ATPase [Desulfocicer niacini]
MKQPDIVFYMGKGGTGKSTVSALAGLGAAMTGKKVLVVSMDAAHNLSDIFETPLNHTPKEVSPGLFAGEIDQERMIQIFLKETQHSLKKNYSYLTAFNLEKHFDILKFSPGLEEHALIMAFEETLKTWDHMDLIIFDMPPTALSVKFFNLPALSHRWMSQLQSLREEINRKKEIVNRVKLAGKTYERDKILKKINDMKANYQALEKQFQDQEQVSITVVLNPNPLALSETERIYRNLETAGISLSGIIWNRTDDTTTAPTLPLSFKGPSHLCLPRTKQQLTGIKALKTYLNALDSKDCARLSWK